MKDKIEKFIFRVLVLVYCGFILLSVLGLCLCFIQINSNSKLLSTYIKYICDSIVIISSVGGLGAILFIFLNIKEIWNCVK